MSGGFDYQGSLSDGHTGKLRTYGVAASHASRIAIGDVVRISGTANATTGEPEVDVATATQSVTGVVSGISPNFATENFTDVSLAASTAGSVQVIVDPHAEYEVDVSNGPLAVADVGLNVDLVATAATASGGLTVSNMTVNATGKATTATLPFRVTALLVGSDGVLGSRCKVRVNNSTAVSGATGV
jgi:hypothetical protein